MNLSTVMDAIGTQLDTIAGLRVHAHPPDKVSPPAAVVGYPNTITFDVAIGRGQDQIEIPVYVVVGKVSDRASRDVLAPYCAGSGAASVKAVLEAKNGTWSGLSRVRVASVDFDTVTAAGVEYLAAVFTLDVYGTGA